MTRDLILEAAFQIATSQGYDALRRDKVANRAGVATGSVSHHFKDMDGLRTAVMQEAVNKRNLNIIAMGLAQSHPVAMSAPAELKREALETLV